MCVCVFLFTGWSTIRPVEECTRQPAAGRLAVQQDAELMALLLPLLPRLARCQSDSMFNRRAHNVGSGGAAAATWKGRGSEIQFPDRFQIGRARSAMSSMLYTSVSVRPRVNDVTEISGLGHLCNRWRPVVGGCTQRTCIADSITHVCLSWQYKFCWAELSRKVTRSLPLPLRLLSCFQRRSCVCARSLDLNLTCTICDWEKQPNAFWRANLPDSQSNGALRNSRC